MGDPVVDEIETQSLLRKLSSALAHDADEPLSKKERARVRKLLKFLDRMEALGWIGKWVIYAAATVGGFIGALEGIKRWWLG